MKLFAIYAQDQKGLIGLEGQLPWHVPGDLKYFKKQTMDSPLIMGRNTFQSLPGILPDRPHIVVTSRHGIIFKGKRYSRTMSDNGVVLVPSIEEAISRAEELSYLTQKAFVIGGSQLLNQMLPMCARIYISHLPLHIPVGPDQEAVYAPIFEGQVVHTWVIPAEKKGMREFEVKVYKPGLP